MKKKSNQDNFQKMEMTFFPPYSSRVFPSYLSTLIIITFILFSAQSNAQTGTWKTLTHAAPHTSGGTMFLLSDGTVLSKTTYGGTDGEGNTWDRLTPDIHGSYLNGTWTSIAPMHNTRRWFSSQLLMDGRLYVAGGEYGTRMDSAEIYNPLTNVWTSLPYPGGTVSDANAEILPDGRILQALVTGTLKSTVIYNPVTNKYSTGPTCLGIHNESVWVKLPDSSILFVNRAATSSERYIPKQNKWVADATVPVSLYDPYGDETGPAFLLPDGRVFFIGSPSVTAYYTPSGTASPGTWAAGPAIPNAQGAPDAPGAMMVSGVILLDVSPTPTSANHAPTPTAFYEFDYLSNSFTQIIPPTGGTTTTTINANSQNFNMLDLPDGTVLVTEQQSKSTYYVYTPADAPLAAGKPTINNITNNGSTCDTFKITGTLFNGISEGAAFGDDSQMETNFPIIRLSSGTSVYYARTFNWNSTGVMRGSHPDTTEFTLPAGLPAGTYSLVVTANGNASDPVTFVYPCAATDVSEIANASNNTVVAYPNPAHDQATIFFRVNDGGNYTIKMLDVLGRTVKEETSEAVSGNNTHLINLNGISKGVYITMLKNGEGVFKTTKIIIE